MLRVSLLASSLLHAALIGGLYVWRPLVNSPEIRYAVALGEPVSITLPPPTPAERDVEELEPPEETTDVKMSADEMPEMPARPPAVTVSLPEEKPVAEPPPVELAAIELEPVAELPDLEAAPEPSPEDFADLPNVSPPATPTNTPPQQANAVGARVDQLPQKLPNNPPPLYPADALRGRWEGRVMIRVTVTTDGTVRNASIYRSSGWRSLDAAALGAVTNWRFSPARRAGQAVNHEVVVPVRFFFGQG
ncbi:MAG: TonB family protein [Planctomycetota bacterium]|nr:MAG: TonB family protein [Planctomycetota bacterium]REK39351.1 MAG: TonB family protein [Planctomycetota bacterium]